MCLSECPLSLLYVQYLRVPFNSLWQRMGQPSRRRKQPQAEHLALARRQSYRRKFATIGNIAKRGVQDLLRTMPILLRADCAKTPVAS